MIINSNIIQKALEFTGKHINSPEQRLIQGATALMTQPFFDLHNKDVDEETRLMSVARTLAKIIAGTLVGVLVRQLSITGITKLSQYVFENGSVIPAEGLKGLFVPIFKTAANAINETQVAEQMDLYRKCIGTLVGTLVGLVTNFTIDAPLTKYWTKSFYTLIKKIKTKKEKNTQEQNDTSKELSITTDATKKMMNKQNIFSPKTKSLLLYLQERSGGSK